MSISASANAEGWGPWAPINQEPTEEDMPPQPQPMTPQQMTVFVKAAQAGVACGLSHPLEWYANAYEMNSHLPWIDRPLLDVALADAFVAFYRNTDCQPDDPVSHLDADGLRDMLDKFYSNTKCHACYRELPGRS